MAHLSTSLSVNGPVGVLAELMSCLFIPKLSQFHFISAQRRTFRTIWEKELKSSSSQDYHSLLHVPQFILFKKKKKKILRLTKLFSKATAGERDEPERPILLKKQKWSRTCFLWRLLVYVK